MARLRFRSSHSNRVFRRHHQPLERLEARQLLASAVAGMGTGLIANYFSDQALQNLALTRVDSGVNFDWGRSAPAASLPSDNFSVRWSGKVQAQFTETYTFYTQTDEGVALWVNGQQIIDDFTDHTLAEDSGTISLQAGEMYDIRLEYYDNQFEAAAKLLWSSDSTPKQIIPQSQLYADAGWTNSALLNTGIGGAPGSVSSIGQSYTLSGGGDGLGADQEEFLYQTLQGDGSIVAQVSGQDNLGGNARAGLMIRDGLGSGSALASLSTSPSGTPALNWRDSSFGAVVNGGSNGIAGGKYWLKLQRDGNFVRAYASASGADGTWSLVGTRNIPMDHTAYVGVFATSGSAGTLNRATFKNLSVNASVPMGSNLDAVRDYSFGQVFVDVVKQARAFQAPNLGPSVPTDANGWPEADCMTILASGFANQGHLLNGTYKVSFTGQATIGTWITPGGQIRNQTYNAATNTTTCDLVVNAPESQDNWYIALQLTDTRRNPGDSPGGGITNLKVIRPGYDPNTTQTFTDPYLQYLKQFSVLRFMDWTGTNDSTVVNWSDRTLMGSARQSGDNGVAWEYVAQLANQLHKDLWVNVPAMASDDYVRNLATLLKGSLDPDRVVYVEYSNEVWNGTFSQYTQNLNAAIAEVNAGNSPLNADGSTNQIYWGWRHTAERIKQISDIFAGVWGASQINARVRPVLAGQQSNPEVLRQGIEFLERTYGSPGRYLWGVAAAPYFSAHSIDTSNPGLTVDQYIAALQQSVTSQQYFNFDSYARRYGLQNMAYEGGSDTFGPNNISTKYAASMDPRFQNLVEQYLTTWYADGGGLFNWFVAGPTNWKTSFGTWGTTPALDQPDTPKNVATTDVATTPRQPLQFGQSIPLAIDARAIAGAAIPYSTSYLPSPGRGKSFDYFVRVPRAGTYQLTFLAGTSGSSEQLRVAINSTDVRTITLKNTGSRTGFTDNLVGNFRMEEGMNLIHVTSVNESAGWNMQTVTVAPGAAPTAAPSVAVPASASETVTSGKSVDLSVLGADSDGESTLSYSWDALNQQPLGVIFGANGTNAAKNTTATFTQAGSYQLRCTISDGVSSVSSTVTVTVNQSITSVSVTPTGTALANGEQRQFFALAKDQFGVQMYSQPTFSWSVDNGFGTVDSSGLYTAPATGLGSAGVRATAPGGISGATTVVTQSPAPPDNPADAVSGLDYSYFQGNWTSLPNFDALTPIKTGLTSNLSLTPKQTSDHYGFQFTGYVFVPGSGTYTFYTTSDDGSKLWVGGSLVVNNDGTHGAQERSGTIILESGWHQFKVAYFDSAGNDVLTASYSGPGLSSKTQIPDAALERVDRAPTIITPPSANPSEVTGKTADLSVFGADESGESALTYTWSTIGKPIGAPDPTFTSNGSNAAKSSTVNFSQAGSYTLQVAISDGTLTTVAQLPVIVDQTLTSLVISPASTTVRQNRQAQFSVSAYDQFGAQIMTPPQVNWSAQANGGSIDSTGLYTAPTALGTYQITASLGAISASASAIVVGDNAPTIVQPAQASPNPVADPQSGTTLTILGADDGGESNLTYTWNCTARPDGANFPIFSANGTNASKTTGVTFSQPGTYTMLCTVSDGLKVATSSVDVQVAVNGPTVATPASASPNPVTGSTTNLSVLGADAAHGESSLTYTWTTLGTPPAPVAFSSNGTNASKNVTATFSQAGTYDFAVSISNGSASASSNVSVQVSQTYNSVRISPGGAVVAQGSSLQFSAVGLDQFGDAMSPAINFSWSISSTGNPGTITQTGLYTAPSSGTPIDTVIASANGRQSSANVTVIAASHPAYGSSDIGSPAIAGSTSFSNGVYTLKGSGADIWNNSDSFHFMYVPLSGDGQIVTRVTSMQFQGATQLRAKAGVMMRDSLSADARNVMLAISPDNSTTMQQRMAAGNGTGTVLNLGGSSAPFWLKLTRIGSTFTGYRSVDGVNWTTFATTTGSMGQTIYVGLATNSHDDSQLVTSTFDNVSIGAITNSPGSIPATPLSARISASSSLKPSVLLDGNTSTFFQAKSPNDAWIGFDFGRPRKIDLIDFAPREGYAFRIDGGRFEASNSRDFKGGVVELYQIPATGETGGLTSVPIHLPQSFRYVRYIAPKGSFGNLAEAHFYGT